jgi:hypothetical protein
MLLRPSLRKNSASTQYIPLLSCASLVLLPNGLIVLRMAILTCFHTLVYLLSRRYASEQPRRAGVRKEPSSSSPAAQRTDNANVATAASTPAPTRSDDFDRVVAADRIDSSPNAPVSETNTSRHAPAASNASPYSSLFGFSY